MTGYTYQWHCKKCGRREETIDRPKVNLCNRCDDQTQARCVVCGQPTKVTPSDLYRRMARRAVHNACVIVDST